GRRRCSLALDASGLSAPASGFALSSPECDPLFLELGSWFLELGSWFLELCSWFLELCSWFLARVRPISVKALQTLPTVTGRPSGLLAISLFTKSIRACGASGLN